MSKFNSLDADVFTVLTRWFQIFYGFRYSGTRSSIPGQEISFDSEKFKTSIKVSGRKDENASQFQE